MPVTNYTTRTLPYGTGWNPATHSYDTAPNTTGAIGTGVGASSALGAYNVVPSPTGGQGAYGLVPGPTGIPPSTYQQALSANPALAQGATDTSNVILKQLQGELDPQTVKNIQDVAAQYGIKSGMAGSNAIPGTLAFNENLRNIGLDTQALQQQGVGNYLNQLSTTGGMQINPALAAQIAQENAQLAAAPDPAQAAQALQNFYANALNALRGPGGGTGGYAGASPAGGTGGYSTGSGALGFGGAGGVNVQQPSGALGFGFGSFPTNVNYGQNVTSVPGATLTNTPLDPSLFGDIGFGGSGTTYDQSASFDPFSTDYTQAYDNPTDYYAGILAGT